MRDIVYGQPNLYFLFMAMGAKFLKKNGEFIYIVPRSFSSGLYFSAFRKWFLSEMRITNLHLFTSREAVSGKNDNVLQETIILKAIKTGERISNIVISESVGELCADAINSYTVNYRTCVNVGDNAFLYFPTCEEDAMILDFVNSWESNLLSLGFRMRTGLLVDFRERDWLKQNPGSNTIPLLWAYNFNGANIRFPIEVSGKPQYLEDTPSTKRLQMNKGNYLLLKRFTSKEENRRLQCALLFEDDFSDYPSISTENHLNFITKEHGEMLREEMYGLYVVLNSSYLDRYFRILNGSTQVNATEINAIPFPPIDAIKEMGRQAMRHSNVDESLCDAIIEERLMQQQIRKAM
jgi:adenine-specific DNA-methyltransferase